MQTHFWGVVTEADYRDMLEELLEDVSHYLAEGQDNSYLLSHILAKLEACRKYVEGRGHR